MLLNSDNEEIISKGKPLSKKNGFNLLNRTIETPVRSYAVVKFI